MARPQVQQVFPFDDKPSSIDEACFLQVVNGGSNTTTAPNPACSNVRVYLHSDCTDSHYERQRLWQDVIPVVSAYARSLGLYFHFVDPYHMLTARGANNDSLAHILEIEGVYDLNMKEVVMSQDISAGISFITLFGQKYGHRTLKTEIDKEDFNLLSNMIEDVSMKSLLKNRYKLDRGTVPQRYTLKGPDHITNEWIKEHGELARTIRKGAKVAFGKDPIKVQNYTLSVNEEELTQGIFNCPNNVNQSCVWFKRTFTDLTDQRPSSDPSLSQYSDVCISRRGAMEFDSETVKLLNYLKEARMPARYIGLDSSNIFDFPIKWHKNEGLSPDYNDEHSAYLSNLSKKLTKHLKENLKDVSDRVESELGSTCYQECLLHAKYCKKILADVKERPGFKDKLVKYLQQLSGNSKPLVLYGPSGSGKSNMAAVAIKHVLENAGESRCCIFRFIGQTAPSRNIRTLLESICKQMILAYNDNGHAIPAEYNSLIKVFHHLISTLPSSTKPMYIILDGLDYLVKDNQGLSLAWLPVKLPPFVRLFVSVASEDSCRCHLILRSIVNEDTFFVNVPTFDLSEAETFLEFFLNQYKLKITSTHLFLLSDALKMRSFLTPLYLKTLAFISKHFHTSLQHQKHLLNLKSAMNLLFDNIEESHGRIFVSTLLSLITISNHGMAENELLDILSCDDEVLTEIQAKCSNLPIASIPIRQVPQIIWSRILYLLYPTFLCFRMAVGGVWVLQWVNREVHDIAFQRYLQSVEAMTKSTQTLADYFSGKMADERSKEQQELLTQNLMKSDSKNENQTEAITGDETCKNEIPVPENETTSSEDNMADEVPRPPLIRPINSQILLLSEDVYNIRKMAELPHALHGAKQYNNLVKLVFDYHFLRANVTMRLLDNVLLYLSYLFDPIDIEYNGIDLTMKNEVSLLYKALFLSLDNLMKNPAQLSIELLGRLLPYAMDSNERPRINNLLVQAVSKDLPCLLPVQSYYSKVPQENLLLTMSGHYKGITQVDSTIVLASDSDKVHEEMVIISSSIDGKLRSWDWRGSGTLKTFNGHSGAVFCVALAKNGRYVASGGEDRAVRFWRVADATCVHELKGHKDSIKGVCVTKQSTKVISGSLDATVKVWNTDQSSSCKGQLMFSLNPSRMARSSDAKSPVHSICLCKDDTELVCGLGNGTIVIINILAGEMLRSFETSQVSMTTISSIAIAQLNDRRIVISVSDDSAHLCCYDTGKHIDSIPCRFPGIYGKLASRNQSNILNRIPETLMNDSSVTTFSFLNLGALGITGSEDGTLRVWDLENSETQTGTQATFINTGRVCATTTSQCGKYIGTAYENGRGTISRRNGSVPTIIVWLMSDLTKPYISLEAPTRCTVTGLKFFKSNQLVSSHVDGTVRFWNIDTRQIEDEFSCMGSGQEEYSHTGSGDVPVITCFGISSDCKVLSVGTEDGLITTWNMERKSKISRKLDGHTHPIISILFVPALLKATKYIITGDKGGSIIVREYKTLDIIENIDQLEDRNGVELCCLEVGEGLNDQTWLMGGAYCDGSIKIWSVPDLRRVTSFRINEGSISSIGFIRNKIVTTVNRDDNCGCVQIWDEDICVGKVITDSGITTATVKPIEPRGGGLIIYGCEDGYTGVYLYDPYARNNKEKHVMEAVLSIQQRPKSMNSLKIIEEIVDESNGRGNKVSEITLQEIIPENVTITDEKNNEKEVSSIAMKNGVNHKATIPPTMDKEGVANENEEGVISNNREGVVNDEGEQLQDEPRIQTSSCTII